MSSSDADSQTRLRTELVFVLGLVYGVLAGVILALFYHRRFLDPIKARSPILLLIANVSALVLTVYAAIRQKYLSEEACPDVFWLLFTLFPACVFPYFLRCVRLYFQYTGQMKKVTDLALKFASERFNVQVLCWALLFDIAVCGIVQGVAWPALNGTDQQECREFVGFSFYVVAAALLVFMFLFIGAIYVLRGVRDEFSITTELKLVCLCTVLCLTPFFVISIVVGPWPKSAYPPLFFGILSVFCLIISVLWPLVKSYQLQRSSRFASQTMANATSNPTGIMSGRIRGQSIGPQVRSDDARTPLNPDSAINFIQFIQMDAEHLQIFKTFLVRTFQLPLLNFWLEVQDYNEHFSSWTPPVQQSNAQKIVETYIESESRWELEGIELEARKRVLRNFPKSGKGQTDSAGGQTTFSSSIVEEGYMATSGQIASPQLLAHLFDEVQRLVRHRLECEIWESFLSSQTMQKWKGDRAKDKFNQRL